MEHISGISVQRFLISGLELTITATASIIPGTSVQRFLISEGQFNNRCSNGAHFRDIRAVILDFKPRLANRCSQEVKTRAILALILDFKPRLANRCSKEVKSGAIRASILDFSPRLENRCSTKVKTGANPPAQGMKHCAAAGECRMGRDFGRRSRPWLREREGPAAQRREGKHRRCAPVRSPCPQAESSAEYGPCPQAAFAQRIPRRQTRPQSRNN